MRVGPELADSDDEGSPFAVPKKTARPRPTTATLGSFIDKNAFASLGISDDMIDEAKEGRPRREKQ